MIFLYIVVAVMMPPNVFGEDYTPELHEYLLYPLPLLPQLNVIDGLPITNVTTTPSKNRLPSKAQMMYYNYHSAVNYYYDLEHLTCEYCQKIKPDIANHTGEWRNAIQNVVEVCKIFSLPSFIQRNA